MKYFKKKLSDPIIQSFLACLFQGVSSITILLALRRTYAVYKIDQPTVVILFQQAFNFILTFLLWIYFRTSSSNPLTELGIKPPSFTTFYQHWIILFLQGSLYLVTILFSQYALKQINLPLFSSWRRTNPLMIVSLNYLRDGKTQQWRIWGCLLLLAAGAFIVNLNQNQLDLVPILLVLMNNLTGVFHGWSIVEVKAYKIGPLEMNLANSINMTLLVLIVSLITGELNSFLSTGAHLNFNVMFYILVASFCGVMVSFASILCSIVTSPLASAVTGAIKDSFLNALVFTFAGEWPTLLQFTGSVISIGAGLGFSLLRLQKMKKKIN